MSATSHLARNDTEGHGHPVDFWGECLSDYCEFHGRRGLRIPMCTVLVPMACRTSYDFGKSLSVGSVGGPEGGAEGGAAGGSAGGAGATVGAPAAADLPRPAPLAS